jgi:epoxyqueuosine reductase QueG
MLQSGSFQTMAEGSFFIASIHFEYHYSKGVTMSLDETMKAKLTDLGADLVGFADLTIIPAETRRGFPVGISVGVCVPREIVNGITEAPTLVYWDYYNSDHLNNLAAAGTEFIRSLGYEAFALTKESVKFVGSLRSELPYKTVATCAGLGWIGKCGLLVTEQFGTAVWFSVILTNAPLRCAEPTVESRCGKCSVCVDACPANAISGKLWSVETDRDAFLDAAKCASYTRQRAKELINVDWPLCGRCIAVCPRTKKYLNDTGSS